MDNQQPSKRDWQDDEGYAASDDLPNARGNAMSDMKPVKREGEYDDRYAAL